MKIFVILGVCIYVFILLLLLSVSTDKYYIALDKRYQNMKDDFVFTVSM